MKRKKTTTIGDIFAVKIDNHHQRFFQYIVSDMTMLNSSVIRVFKKEYLVTDVIDWNEVVRDEVDFYAHTILRVGLDYDLWDLVANVPEVGDYSHIWFRSAFKKNVLIIGMGHTAEKLSGIIKSNRFSLMDVRAFINCNNSSLLPHAYQQVQVVESDLIYPLDEIEEVIQKESVTTAIIAVPQLISSDIEILMKLLNDKVDEIKVLPRTETLVTFDSRIDDFDGLLMISTAQSKITLTSRFFKRILDIIGGIVGCIALVPLYFFVRHKNRKEGDYGPVMFRQVRIGKDGKEFTIYKFRTMVENAEAKLEELMRTDPAIREEYLTNKKLVNDPRITKAGKFLRRTSLDEFPQFINVIKGEMSLIGPRPYLPREKEDMGDFYHTIIQMKPGLTGMWQTHGRSDTDFVTRLSLDDYYFRNYSLWLDVTILIRTVKTILGGRDETAR